MGIEQFVLEKGEVYLTTGGTGQIDNRLGEIVFTFLQNYPIFMDFLSI